MTTKTTKTVTVYTIKCECGWQREYADIDLKTAKVFASADHCMAGANHPLKES